jgi:hypothetical protein
MKPYQVGIILRLLGPLIEIVSVIGFVQFRGRDARVGGVPVESLCFAGFGLGLVLVVAGLSLTAFRPRRRKTRPRFTLDLGPDEPNPPPPTFDDQPETEPTTEPGREPR